MPKAKSAAKQLAGFEATLDKMRAHLSELGYSDLRGPVPLMEIEPGRKMRQAALVAYDADQPAILCHPAEEGKAEDPLVQEDAKYEAGIIGSDVIAPFVWVSDGSSNWYYSMIRESAIPALPQCREWRSQLRTEEITPTRKRHIQDLGLEYFRGDYREITRKFNELHEAIYGRRAGVGTTNEAIDEVCKLVFLKIHQERHPGYRVQALGKPFAEIFNAVYIRRNTTKAIEEIRDAFHEIKKLEEYTDENNLTGVREPIFASDEPFRLSNPEVLALAVEIFQGIQLSATDEDLLGRAFDIFLRGKYESSGGLATYLTPREVVEAMVRIAFHDIGDGELWEGYPDDPKLLVGDLCCGTGRFLIGAMAETKRRILDSAAIGKSDAEKKAWWNKVKRVSFFGADAAPGSVLKARINMLLYGDGHSQVLRVEDSILDQRIDRLMGKFNLILTNPPFGTGKYVDENGLAKMRGERKFCAETVHSLLDDWRYQVKLGWSWKSDPTKRKELTSADPAALFVDRNLQMIRPSGRLVIVVPDGLLSNSGDRYIREYLMGKKDEETGKFRGGKSIVKAVVSLPTQTFAMSGTGAKTSFLYLQKKRSMADEQEAIFMAVANHVGFLKKGQTEIPDPEGNDLAEISQAYERGS